MCDCIGDAVLISAASPLHAMKNRTVPGGFPRFVAADQPFDSFVEEKCFRK
jgi:hypothetical protein